MARDQNSKMAHFVAQKNGQPAQNGKKVKSHEDLYNLKIPPHGKTAAASNTPIVREPSQRKTRSSTVKNEHVPDGTDFSAIDRSSTESGTKRAHSHGDKVQTDVQDQAAPAFESDQMIDRPESQAGNEAEVQYDNSSIDGMPNDPFKQFQQARQQNGNTQIDHERATMHPGRNPFAAQQIQGDSYPPTTSGNPSVTDQRDGLSPYSTQPPEIHYPAKANGALPTRAAGTRVRHVDPAQVTNQNQQNHNPQVEPAARIPALPYGAPPLSNINAGFSFQPGPAMKQGGTLAPPPAPPPQHGIPPQVHQAVTNVTQRGSPPDTNLSARQDGRHRLAHSNVQPVAAELPEKQRHLQKPPGPSSTHAPAIPPAEQASFPQSRPTLTQRHELTSRTQENDPPLIDNRKFTNYRESSYNEGHAQEEHDERLADEADEEPDLYDYEVEEICQMDFAELKNESFDVDPQADEFQLPGNQQHGTFQDKLHAVLELPGEVQSGFFKSLPADQWEEAGDWFLDQFGDVLKKFKDARQSKRKAAMEFEDEIEKRHEAVSKKRKVMEDALGEMRKTGAVVLQGTPKKLKKSK